MGQTLALVEPDGGSVTESAGSKTLAATTGPSDPSPNRPLKKWYPRDFDRLGAFARGDFSLHEDFFNGLLSASAGLDR